MCNVVCECVYTIIQCLIIYKKQLPVLQFIHLKNYTRYKNPAEQLKCHFSGIIMFFNFLPCFFPFDFLLDRGAGAAWEKNVRTLTIHNTKIYINFWPRFDMYF